MQSFRGACVYLLIAFIPCETISSLTFSKCLKIYFGQCIAKHIGVFIGPYLQK